MRGIRSARHLWELRRLAGRVLGLASGEGSRIFAGLAAGAGVALFEIARPWPLKFLFDFVLLDTPAHGAWIGAARWGREHTETAIVVTCAAVVAVAALRAVLSFCERWSLEVAAARMVFRLRCRLFAHVQKLSPAFHAASRSGDLLMRLTGDVRILSSMLSGSLPTLSSTLFLLIGTGVVMLAMDPVLWLVASAAAPVAVIVAGRLTGRLRNAVRRQRQKEGALAATVHEALAGMLLVQAFGRERAVAKQFGKRSRKTLREGLRARRLQVALETSMSWMVALSVCLIIGIGVWRVRLGVLSPGDLLVFVAYVESMHRPVALLAKMLARLGKAASCGERVFAILDRDPDVADVPGARPAPRFSGRVAFDDVSFGYRSRHPVLRAVSFTVEPGELVALVGRSGAGKTTILNLLLRFYDPWTGRILFDGVDLRAYTLASVRAQIAVAMQDTLLFGTTIFDNIAFGDLNASPEEVVAAAQMVGADEFIRRLPAGYDTEIGENGALLSGGQQRLISIARAALRSSPVVILDEPASGLDAESERVLTTTVKDTLAGRTRFVIAHSFSTIIGADRILMFDEGRLMAEGRHHELYARCDAYRDVCDLQFGRDPMSPESSPATAGIGIATAAKM